VWKVVLIKGRKQADISGSRATKEREEREEREGDLNRKGVASKQ
jgi:hypothetical protein